jgi:simple sugar transport system permease protein
MTDAAVATSRHLRSAGMGVVQVVAVTGVAVLAVGALLAATGFDTRTALASLWQGSVGSADAFMSATLVRATPLMLAGVGVTLALRAGVLNIGAEGQLLTGATAGLVVIGAGGLAPSAIWGMGALIAAGCAGAAWAGLSAWLRHRFGSHEVVTTIMMNFVALHLVSFLVRGPLQEPTGVYPQSDVVPESVRLPFLVEGTRLHAGLFAALLAALLAWVILERTAAGFRIRMVGANAEAARSAGRIRVARVEAGAFLMSGALAGVAGGVQVLGVTYALYETLSPGYGYTAIAAALIAGLRPLAVIWSAVLLGALGAGATAMQRDAGIPAGAAAATEAALIVAVLAAQAVMARRARRRRG